MIVGHQIRNGSLYGIYAFPCHTDYLFPHSVQGYLDFFHVGGQQGQAGKSCRTDGKALAGSGGSIAKGIKDIRTASDLRVESAHLGIASGIVGYRAVSIRSECDSESGKHSDCSDSDTVEAETQVFSRQDIGEVEIDGAQVGKHYGHGYGYHRYGSGDHAESDPGNDHRGRSGLRTLGQFLRGLVGM